jgi:hypothetical protein
MVAEASTRRAARLRRSSLGLRPVPPDPSLLRDASMGSMLAARSQRRRSDGAARHQDSVKATAGAGTVSTA